MTTLIIAAIILAFVGISTAAANDMGDKVTLVMQQDQITKIPVKYEALSYAIKATLSSDKYKEWTPTSAAIIVKANKAEYHEVDVEKAGDVISLKISRDGVVIK